MGGSGQEPGPSGLECAGTVPCPPQACGSIVRGPGWVCCNPVAGIGTLAGQACTQ